ncbi:MAG: hypothetical protein KC621_26310, partial [Myxococcales bacterium]|nr:hypothetical protein [Myxococcales bacterium]
PRAGMGVVHTSWSHTWTHPEWRLVMPLEQPVPAAAWSGVWGWASARVDGKKDTKCKDAGRLYFVPARPPDAPNQAMRIEGRPLDLPDSVLRPPAPPTRLPPRVPRPRGRRSEVFKTDAGARRDLGVALGGQLVAGETQVKGVKCPACGRPSLTWYVPIGPALKATCNHRNSCAASYWLDELAA